MSVHVPQPERMSEEFCLDDGQRVKVHWINGPPYLSLAYRPPQPTERTDVQKAVHLLNGLTADQRVDVFGHYCKHCGDTDPRCRCWDDS